MLEGAKEYELNNLESSEESQQPVQMETARVERPIKQVLAICGVIGILLFGFWAYSHQSSSDPDTSPTKTNSSSL
jgi:hypothetical protein